MNDLYKMKEWKTYNGYTVSNLLGMVVSVDKTMEIFYTVDPDGKELQMILTDNGNLAVSRYDGISSNRNYLMVTTEGEYLALKEMCSDEA